MDPIESSAAEKMKNFIAHHGIKSLHDMHFVSDKGVFVVVAWFDEVVEGVDMWFKDNHSTAKPSFRMKLKVRDGEEVGVFT
ncbi:hypothetical protein A2U01_0028590 [Trifolium medium]|uniref:Uncharacterized protein n=1 Tax=Trifolium medium TaxID=97028 RepID=A0A392P627_9FABA|nr:hypothetical protein [Trifolium medium]